MAVSVVNKLDLLPGLISKVQERTAKLFNFSLDERHRTDVFTTMLISWTELPSSFPRN